MHDSPALKDEELVLWFVFLRAQSTGWVCKGSRNVVEMHCSRLPDLWVAGLEPLIAGMAPGYLMQEMANADLECGPAGLLRVWPVSSPEIDHFGVNPENPRWSQGWQQALGEFSGAE